jgi:hypothetical protein
MSRLPSDFFVCYYRHQPFRFCTSLVTELTSAKLSRVRLVDGEALWRVECVGGGSFWFSAERAREVWLPEFLEPRISQVSVRLQRPVVLVERTDVRRMNSYRYSAPSLFFVFLCYVSPVGPAVTGKRFDGHVWARSPLKLLYLGTASSPKAGSSMWHKHLIRLALSVHWYIDRKIKKLHLKCFLDFI